MQLLEIQLYAEQFFKVVKYDRPLHGHPTGKDCFGGLLGPFQDSFYTGSCVSTGLTDGQGYGIGMDRSQALNPFRHPDLPNRMECQDRIQGVDTPFSSPKRSSTSRFS